MRVLRSALPAAALCVAALPAMAQVSPSSSAVAAYTGLHAAAHRGDAAAIDWLVSATSAASKPASTSAYASTSASTPAPTSHKAIDARDANGRTPLHVATFARQRDAIRALLESGADHAALENDRYDAVTIASVANDEETLRLLLARGASAKLVTSRYEGTALIAAAHLGHDGVVRQLIAAGAPLDHVNNLHWTALIESIVLGDGGPRHLETLQALLNAGASTQLADREGRTPLQLAKARGYEAMIKALIAAGAR